MTQTAHHRELPAAALAALEKGSKIEAIKIVRIDRGIGLKEAKDVVEQYLDARPDLQSRMNTASLEAAKGSLGWIFLVAVVALVAYYFYTGNR
ncbi:MAG: ribosomal protein L7/L12 [Burkholderiales bacterium]